MTDIEIVVIGSGLSGLAFARFYLEIHPQTKIAILEADYCIGGVWSSSRSYDEFWSQSGRRMSGFSDVNLTVPDDAPLYYDTFEAKYLTQYLEDYVDSHVYNGASLRIRILLEHRVHRVEKTDGTWIIHVDCPGKPQLVLKSSKLVVATGHTSIPNMPYLPNQKHFEGHIFHHKAFGKASRSVLADPSCKRVTVLGGGKSAVDMVYESAKKGKNVTWIIRKSGEGPALFFPAAGKGRYKNVIESAATRYKACFSPSSFMPNLWLLRLFHRTSYGMHYVANMIQNNDQHCRDQPAYQTRDGALPGFQDLDFTTSAFWYTGPVGLAQHEDFWDTIAQNVHIHRKDISSMRSNTITLEDGIEVPTDVLLCGTGWKSTYPFLSKDLACSLGLPHALEESLDQETKLWQDLLKVADHQVLASFPLLENPPPSRKIDALTTTAKLYKGIAPLQDHSIAFLGHIDSSNSFRAAEVQAIWTTAYFDGSINMPPPEQAQKEVAFMNAFSRRRYPSRGQKGDCVFGELIWYSDDLLQDVGLKSHQKGLWSNWVEPCLQADLKNMPNEYRKKYGF